MYGFVPLSPHFCTRVAPSATGKLLFIVTRVKSLIAYLNSANQAKPTPAAAFFSIHLCIRK